MSLDTARFRFIADALDGAGVFRPSVTYDSEGRAVSVNSTAIVQYPRESKEKFARRNDVAWYENHMLSSCRRFVGYLAKKPPLRDVGNPLLEDFAADCNWRGDSLDVFWQGFMVEAKARGSMLLLVDMPASEAQTMAEQREMRFFPYLVTIKPEDVTNYSLDDRGRLSVVEYGTTWDGRPAIKGWDIERWWVKQEGKEVAGDQHNLGLCPVIAFSENGDFPSFGDFAQIADISKRLFNARSELDEILRAQTFSLLHYHVPQDQHDFNASSVAEAIGTHNMLIHRGDAPGFIAPPSGPAEIYLDTISKLEEALKRVALVVEAPEEQSAESGLALTIRFQALNSALTGFARKMEDFERRMWDVACAWLNLPSDRVTVEWAKDYALADIQMELQVLGAMQAQAFPDEAIRQQQKQVAALAFSTAPPDEFQAIIDAIDESGSEVVPESGNDDQVADAPSAAPVVAAPATVIDMQPVADAIAAMKQPIVNVQVDAPVINMPEQQAPVVNVAPAVVNISAPEPAAPAPASSLVVNTGSNPKVIELVRDTAGNVTGANVREA